ncbi:hypothetical protein CDL12_22933 [Handroanthus impetiginosus]|uniref:Uncharacterized protein n=1 Tax=Handroanthus impetiginosus TaxID=429701 RepID=A0A2G9GGV9_9LAMI|nr:hypothetical protein CDL12_22933 [Handroanthus impetiginosus]
MKNFSMIVMLCLAIVLPLYPPSLGDDPCGSGGQQDCLFKVLAQYPASSMPKKIKCVDIGRTKANAEIICP